MSKRVLEKLKHFLRKDERQRIEKRKKLHKIIKKMHQRQKELKEELKQTKDAEHQDKLRKQIVLLKEQRHKAMAVLSELKKKAEADH
jgi:hypothetical protein